MRCPYHVHLRSCSSTTGLSYSEAWIENLECKKDGMGVRWAMFWAPFLTPSPFRVSRVDPVRSRSVIWVAAELHCHLIPSAKQPYRPIPPVYGSWLKASRNHLPLPSLPLPITTGWKLGKELALGWYRKDQDKSWKRGKAEVQLGSKGGVLEKFLP